MSPLAGVRPLLLPASYTPVPTEMLGLKGRHAVCTCGQPFRHMGVRGKLPTLGPCCREKAKAHVPVAPKVPRPLRVIVGRQHYTAKEILHRITRPGCAVVAFDGGVTLFVGDRHFQAASLTDALRAADDARVSP